MVLEYRPTAFCGTFACKCTCGLFLTCVLLDTTCSLCKRVYPYQLWTSSSDVFGIYSWLHVDGHVSDLWVKLTTADRVYNSCTAALTDCKGVSSHSPIFSTILAVWIAPIPEWGNLEGPGCPPHPFLNLTSQMFGYVWVLKARSKTQALLGWAIAPGLSDWGSLLLPTQGSLSTFLNPLWYCLQELLLLRGLLT